MLQIKNIQGQHGGMHHCVVCASKITVHSLLFSLFAMLVFITHNGEAETVLCKDTLNLISYGLMEIIDIIFYKMFESGCSFFRNNSLNL